jgi:hypothetical protein
LLSERGLPLLLPLLLLLLLLLGLHSHTAAWYHKV